VAIEHTKFDSGSAWISNVSILGYGKMFCVLRVREQLECNEEQCGTRRWLCCEHPIADLRGPK